MNELLSKLSPMAAGLPESGIVKVINYGRTKPGLIPFWAGEGDLPTPEFITKAAVRALNEGHTFYTYQRGIPKLRKANVGLAPGSTFGPGGEGFLRICFAASHETLRTGVNRLVAAIDSRRVI